MKLSVVTPSYNQARFLEACIDSVLGQGYPELEYLVMDGGSTDLSVEILRTYGSQVIWVSEPDGGQAAAVNKGIERATGEVIGWLNSDDVYYPEAFQTVMKIFEEHPEINVIYGHADHIKEDGSYLEDYYTEPWDYERLKEVCFICQPAVFFRKKAVCEVGLLDPSRQYAMDYDLWLRMGKKNEFYYINKKLAGSRLYATNKTLAFIEPVHLDIMDAVVTNTGSIPARWLQGSAESVAKSEGYTRETTQKSREYACHVMQKMGEYSERFSYNVEMNTKELPYKFLQNMTIGIDASMALQERLQGVGVTAKELIKSLSDCYKDTSFTIYPAFEDHIEEYCLDNDLFKNTTNVKYAYFSSQPNVINHLKYIFGSQIEEEIDKACRYPSVVFYPSFTFSRSLSARSASVYMLYDLSFLEHIEYSTKENYNYCYRHVYHAALLADYFVSISEYTREKFLEYFPFVEPDRVIVAHLGCKSIYKDKPNERCLNEMTIEIDKPFWLSVGTVEPRKNIISLIYAYAELRKSGITYPLYIAGGKGWKDNDIYKSVAELHLEDDVKFLGFVTDEQLNLLYHKCYAMIYPSFYEGFGLPVLEAMTAGAPVITSNTTSLPEVGGSAALYIDPSNRTSISEAMQMLQKDTNLRNRMIKRGLVQANKFGWDKTAEVIYRALGDAVIKPRKNI